MGDLKIDNHMKPFIYLQEKCKPYWPKDNVQAFGEFNVTLAGEDRRLNYTFRRLKVMKVDCNMVKYTDFCITPW